MSRLTTSIRAHPLFAYFVLAYAFSWIMVALLPVSFIFALLAVFGPTLAALIVPALTDGRIGAGNLLRRVVQWRVGFWRHRAHCGGFKRSKPVTKSLSNR